MKKSKFTEEQIVRFLKEVEVGAKGIDVPQARHQRTDVLRLHGGVAAAAPEGRRSGAGPDEVHYAELALDRHALKDVLSRRG